MALQAADLTTFGKRKTISINEKDDIGGKNTASLLIRVDKMYELYLVC